MKFYYQDEGTCLVWSFRPAQLPCRRYFAHLPCCWPSASAYPRTYPISSSLTRHVQGRLTKEDVDLRMIKALADLPGDRGMEAVDRFSGSSLETVRSKTGFMVRRL